MISHKQNDQVNHRPGTNTQGSDKDEKTRLSKDMWRLYTDIASHANHLDTAMRHSVLWLAAVLLPVISIGFFSAIGIK